MKGGRGALWPLCLLLTGCITLHHAPPPPGSTKFGAPVVVLPARMLDSYLIVEAKGDKGSPWHFLVDTGSSSTLVTAEFAQRYAAKNSPSPAVVSRVQIRTSRGETTVLPAATLGEIQLGAVRFITVPVLIYDCSTLSADLGVKIDGILGFPFFRETLLTLDYPHSRLVLRPRGSAPGPGTTVAFDAAEKTPFVNVRLGDRSFAALLDSGSDEALVLDPDGIAPKFAFGPTAGLTYGTLTGDSTEKIGRLAETLFIGGYAVPRPVVEITSGISGIGGVILKNFSITFDQGSNRVTFYRDATDTIAVPSRRSTGMSFDKRPAYWRVVGVIPGSPAAAAGVAPGDLVTRIDGETTDKWDTPRYERLQANAEEVAYTFLNGAEKAEKRMKVAEIVP